MSETVKTTETKDVSVPATETKAPEQQIGMKDVLSPRSESIEQSVEKPIESVPAKVEVPKSIDGSESITPVVEAIADPKQEGLVKGLQAERKKRQEAQQQLMDLQKRNEELEAQGLQPVDTSHIDAQMKNKILAISESSAKLSHPDYAEKYAAFEAAVYDGPEINRLLYDSVVNSDHPGESAYEAGKMILFQREHGVRLDDQVKSIEAKAIAREREKIRKEVEAELHGKIQTKQNQPTNLLTSRAAGSSGEVPFVQPSMGDVLGHKRRR